MEGKTLFQIKDDILSEISKSFNTTESSILEDVSSLKKWMKTQHHLPEILDDKAIQNFFFLNKCSVEKTKQSIDMYYTLRSKIPDMYENINPKVENMKQLLKAIYWVILPKPTQEMYRVLFCKLRDKSLVDTIDPHEIIGLIINAQELRLKEDVMFGDIFVFDLEGTTFGYLSKFTPNVIIKVLTLYEKVFSIRMKACYVINSTPFVSALVAMVKTIMKPKLFQRIHICSDASILYELLPKDMLPSDYGGEGQSLAVLQDMMIAKFDEYKDRYDLLDKLIVNEDLRPAPLKNDDLLGFYGNFKQLNVD